MPIDSFFTHIPSVETPVYDMKTLVYKNCPDYAFTLSNPKYLQGKLNCYLADKDTWIDGEYIASMDWHRGNLILHICLLDNGQLAVLPSHKVKFKDGTKEFMPYRRISSSWEV